MKYFFYYSYFFNNFKIEKKNKNAHLTCQFQKEKKINFDILITTPLNKISSFELEIEELLRLEEVGSTEYNYLKHSLSTLSEIREEALESKGKLVLRELQESLIGCGVCFFETNNNNNKKLFF